MSIISSFKTHLVFRVPSSQLKTTYGESPKLMSHIIVELEDSDGCHGFGEATPLPDFTGETGESVQLILEKELLPALIGRAPSELSSILQEADRKLPANYASKAALDTALHDLLSRELNVPEYALFGGKCRKRVMINRHIGICTVAEAEEKARTYKAEGYQSLKMKVGINPVSDIERIKVVRKAVGPQIAIRLDANQGYTLHEAVKVLRAVEDENILYCEQPLPIWDLEGHAKLRQLTTVPIGLDESFATVRDVLTIAKLRCADVGIIKLIKCGGLFRAQQLASIAEAAGMACVVTSTFDTQIGAAHCLHLASALPCTIYACDLTCFVSQPKMAVNSHILASGFLEVGESPGCGVSSLTEIGKLSQRKDSD